MMIQSMRSGIMARPGETNACLGCHESRVDAPLSSTIVGSAAAGEPQPLEPWFGEPRLFSYYEEVQPVFDKYCVQCHDVGGPGGEKLLLSADRNLAFNVSYWELRSKEYARVPGAGPHNVLSPNSWGAAQSKRTQIFLKGHEDPQIDAKRRDMGIFVDALSDVEAFRRVATWLDLNAPYYPTYASA